MKVKTQQAADFTYPGNLSFNALMQTKKLHEVNNSHQKKSTYIYFCEDFIVDFQKCDATLQDKFNRLFQEGFINTAGAKNNQGIKFLGSKSNLPKCQIKFAKGEYSTSITHELKIMGTKDRIGVVVLKPLADGPEILIATHFIKGGIHNNKHNGKSLTTKELRCEKQPDATPAKLLTKNGFFKATKPCRTEEKHDNSATMKVEVR
ncbi:MAG: hypothetical protein M3R00_07900 [Pseudomonadota bacterium]|nr:hypothetical protein [Pseudomonadota bacterium]